MYSRVRIRKYLPNGTLKLVVNGYRIADRGGWVRVFIPNGTMRLHSKGTWTPEGTTIAAFDASRRYVVHRWHSPAMSGFYVDIARSIVVAEDTVTYVDLLLDISSGTGEWVTLDEDELPQLSVADRETALRAADEVRALIARGDPPFDADDDLWVVPEDALHLAPSQATELR